MKFLKKIPLQRGKGISKPVGIAAFTVLMLIMAALIVLHHNPLADPQQELIKKIIACVIILAAILVFGFLYDKITVLPMELYQNRRLIWKLAKNDFKKRYAGSYLGAVWAMVQPVVTVVMYYIVFDVIMNARAQMAAGSVDVPYVLFLTAGLVPWFYFNEALTNGTNALVEYNYLVKKVVFKISILPIIKVIAATFIHVFFAGILILIACIYGYYPSIYTIQLVYYSFCMFVLVLALSYSTCAIMVFFKDIAQIISIMLQIGMWATPILWDINGIGPTMQMIVKINPVVYIVNGYRSAIYEKTWFFEDFYSTMYFWIFTVVIFCIGALIFKRLKVHFADVM
ncbi:MAG: ABC transporter permease [Lachnospiraceae bacterium]|nr:ABC transporter permease [Lachnospiraceae bacterium]